jgi:hypothetical protein
MGPDLRLSQASNAQLMRNALTLNPSACKVARLLYYCAAYRNRMIRGIDQPLVPWTQIEMYTSIWTLLGA